MNIKKSIAVLLLVFSGLALAAEPKAEKEAPPEPGLGTQYTEEGADTCLGCHDENWRYPIFEIFKTKHANRADKRTPFAGLQCEACHGPGAKHVEGGGDKNAINNFKDDSFLTVKQRDKFCLACHEGEARIGWHGSTHAANNVACTSCHRIHAAHDPVREKEEQAQVCYRCHRGQRAEFNRPSAHPVRFGRIACSDCHQPHGSNTEAMLAKPTVNQTCYTCHAEKRGPFLWEHAPVAENCTLCHRAHGATRPALLVKTPPLLCQQCHSVAGHPAAAYTGAALPGAGGAGAGFVLAGSCTNCHSQVHGSNHPSGVKLMR
jgi:DmsE family decaheme c-type cytochrome